MNEAINPLDPYGEESWPPVAMDDAKTKTIKSKLDEMASKHKFKYRHERPSYNDLLKDLSTGEKNDVYIYEVREYEDGGPCDRGHNIGWIKARNKHEARALWVIKTKNFVHVWSGYVGFSRTNQADFYRELETLKKKVEKMENIPGIDDLLPSN